tara:strand:+ start:644 stop:1390 length:747 start_codon:yes stop_codon:yes gene_type:complete
MIILSTIIIGLCLLCCFKNKSSNIENFESYNSNDYNCNYLDAVIYINLDHREDRKEKIEKMLTEMNINPNKIHRLSATLNKNNGHKGCAASHIRAIKKAKENNWRNVLILEDDFQLSVDPEDAVETLDDIFSEIENDEWHAIQLSSCFVNKEDCKYKNLHRLKQGTTTSSYILNNTLYDELLNVFQNAHDKMQDSKKTKTTPYAIDQAWGVLQKQKKWYISNPKLGKQGSTHSDIMGGTIQYECFMSN